MLGNHIGSLHVRCNFLFLGRFPDEFGVVLLKFIGQLDEIPVVLVEDVAILDNFVDVGVELKRSRIFVAVEMIFDCLQIHGFFDDVSVVGDSHGNGIDWGEEGPRIFMIFKLY